MSPELRVGFRSKVHELLGHFLSGLGFLGWGKSGPFSSRRRERDDPFSPREPLFLGLQRPREGVAAD